MGFSTPWPTTKGYEHMSGSTTSSPADGPKQGGGQLWKVLTAVFGIAAVGFAVWAFSLNSDLDDTASASSGAIAMLEEQVATVEAEKAAIEQEAEQLALGTAQLADASAEAKKQLSATSEQLAVSEQQVSDATAASQSATTDAQKAQAQAESATVCAKGALSAWDTFLGAENVEQGLSDAAKFLESTKPACDAAGI